MGGAGLAMTEDGSSLFFNPGASAFIEKNEVSLNFTPTFANGTFLEAKTNNLAHTVSPMGTPFSAYGLFHLKDSSSLKLGMAVYTPFGSTIEWEDGWEGRFALKRLQLMSIFFQPTVSYKISDKIGLGIGLIYAYGKVNLQKDLPLQFQDGSYGTAELAGTSHGLGYNAGIYFNATDKLKFALTFRSRIDMNVKKGQATFIVPESLKDKFPSGEFSGYLPLPSVVSLGQVINATENLLFAFDVNYTNWSVYDTLGFDYAINTESLEDTSSPRMYKAAFAFRLGAQYDITDEFKARVGVSFAQTPSFDNYVTPESPDADRISYTIGLGYNFNEKLSFDASLLYTQLKREATNQETQLSGTFKTIVLAPGIQFNYTF
ncbi:MAG: outer membrane protein transport protein [Flavobacteriales bacterium]|nr:outer membrane protein transport protein [Flavobacteriales bacterium]